MNTAAKLFRRRSVFDADEVKKSPPMIIMATPRANFGSSRKVNGQKEVNQAVHG
eukprot:CAMPEP_0185903570 /NCGR_PEP_ID=MMETSP0196C-20130402/2841_1 /TAXON_ID=2932 /ORGANISM="Alexandrium fundyense, Strain CCMP1719" /LENGTH=53 /DNA_ID=CAMNT_0028622657 /DNA_START=48 /DNA_END=205 /DNA_ORIENTATION=-